MSVVSKNAYAVTRQPQRPTPTTKSNKPLGYLPVNNIENHATIVASIAKITGIIKTKICGITKNHLIKGNHQFKSFLTFGYSSFR